ncbi:hypothetical protein V8D89_004582 [Ganoderma adspersum]
MKTFLVIISLAASAFAQLASIVSPTNGSTITAGSQLTVDVHQDGAATDDVQIAIVLGLASCLNTPCTEVVPGQDGVGTILLKSLFDPQRDPSLPQEGLHQNFTMVVPENVLTGPSILSLTHLQMVGANKNAALATTGIIVNVA